MNRQPSPFHFVPSTEDSACALDISADVLAFISDALMAWDHKSAVLEPRSRLGLAILLDACRNDVLTVAERLHEKDEEELQALMPQPPSHIPESKG